MIGTKKVLRKIYAISFLFRAITDNILDAAGCLLVEKVFQTVCFKQCVSNLGATVDGN